MATRATKKSAKKKSAAKVTIKKPSAPKSKPKAPAPKARPRRSSHAARPLSEIVAKARTVKQYEHPTKKRLNNPPVGLVTPDTDPDLSPKTYAYDPHLDPQLVWTGKEEKTALTVDTVSLHVHERIDPYTIIEAVRNKESFVEQTSLFATPAENPPLREAVDFYKHQHDWSNRLIAGDSLLVMNSLLEREGMAGQVQMIYMDPPYGIKYGSNFQPFVDKKNVKDGSDDDLTIEPEMIRAFRDTWELGIHSYLTYLRDRLLLARRLLHTTGSIFVQIGDESLHLVRSILDEVFGSENFVSQISFKTKMPLGTKLVANIYDHLLWYAVDKTQVKYRKLYRHKEAGMDTLFDRIEIRDGSRRKVTEEDFDADGVLVADGRLYRLIDLNSAGLTPSCVFDVEIGGRTFKPTNGKSWKTNPAGMEKLIAANRVAIQGNGLGYVLYHEDFPYQSLVNVWTDTRAASRRRYVVETSDKVIERCLLMTTDPGDLVFDPTCGGGTTPYVSEKWGRRWITCDTSRVSLALSKQRLLTSTLEYFDLVDPAVGVDGGIKCKTVPYVGIRSITNDDTGLSQVMYDQPHLDRNKVRVTGPFTVEAVPAPMVSEMNPDDASVQADATIARRGPTQRHSDWRNELLKTGARGHGGRIVKFSRVEPLSGTRYLHAEAETDEANPRRVVVSFGPDYQPLEQRQVELAWEEARSLDPRPDIVLFAAFQFDPEAAKDIDEMPAAVTKKTTFLKAQMNPDLLTEDLKKKRSSNQSFWLVGRPDVEIAPITTGQDKGKFQVSVHGFDYYDVKTGQIESGDAGRIAMWMLDPDYDGRSIFPRQVFFPNAGDKDGWNRLAKTLRAELDEDLIESYLGTDSIPFTAGQHRRIAVKIIDNRGIESLRVLNLP